VYVCPDCVYSADFGVSNCRGGLYRLAQCVVVGSGDSVRHDAGVADVAAAVEVPLKTDAERHQTIRHEDQVRDQLLETTARLTKCLTVYHKII